MLLSPPRAGLEIHWDFHTHAWKEKMLLSCSCSCLSFLAAHCSSLGDVSGV